MPQAPAPPPWPRSTIAAWLLGLLAATLAPISIITVTLIIIGQAKAQFEPAGALLLGGLGMFYALPFSLAGTLLAAALVRWTAVRRWRVFGGSGAAFGLGFAVLLAIDPMESPGWIVFFTTLGLASGSALWGVVRPDRRHSA